MIQYSYRGYILEIRLVGEASSIRMKKQFNSLVGSE